jgi:hypothetical protein
MSTDKLWLVMAAVGEYEDAEDIPIAVYRSERAALERANKAIDWDMWARKNLHVLLSDFRRTGKETKNPHAPCAPPESGFSVVEVDAPEEEATRVQMQHIGDAFERIELNNRRLLGDLYQVRMAAGIDVLQGTDTYGAHVKELALKAHRLDG